MSEWKIVRLSDLAIIKYGKNQKKVQSEEGTVPIYGTGGLMGYASEALYEKESVLIGRKGTIDKIRYVNFPFWTVDTLFYTIINENKIVPKFLYYNLCTVDFMKMNEGTTIPSLRTETLNKMELSIPDMQTQKQIVSILSALDDKIKLNNKINENLESQAQAIFKSWFVDFEPFGGVMPEDWKIGSLSDIADFQNGYAFKSKELLNKKNENCYDVFKQGHINRGGGFNIDGTKSWYPTLNCTKLSKYILKKSDVLMAMTDMKDNVAILGNTAIMPIDDKYILNQRVGLLRSKGLYSINNYYIYLLKNNFEFLEDLRSRANSGVQVNLSADAIKSSQVVIASDIINKKFCAIAKSLIEKYMFNQLENQRLAQLRDTLLPKLMNGEIDVSEVKI